MQGKEDAGCAFQEGKYSLFAWHTGIALNRAHAFTLRTVAMGFGRCVKSSAFRWQPQTTTHQKIENDDDAVEDGDIDDDQHDDDQHDDDQHDDDDQQDDDADDGDSSLHYCCI